MNKPKCPAPIHPGEVLFEEFMNPMGISINGLARDIAVPPGRISAIVNGKRSITADTALRLRMPVLVIRGKQDEIIPVELGRAVFEAVPNPKSLCLVPGAGYNDWYVAGGKSYLSRLGHFANSMDR